MPRQYSVAPCAICGTSFTYSSRQAKDRPRRFCSRACANTRTDLRNAPRIRTPEQIEQRLWSGATLTPPPAHAPDLDDCWLRGTRKFSIRKGEVVLAARFAWFCVYGEWPTLILLHRCDRGDLGCINPDHLYEGTRAENSADMVAKGRGRGRYSTR